MRPTATHLVLALLVLLAGCTGTIDDAPATQSAATPTTTEPTSSPTPTATPYPNRTATFPPGPKSEPERPAELTAETAAAFALQYEYRASYNRLSGPQTEVGMSEHSCSVESTTAAQSGFVVVVRCSAYVNEATGGNDSTRTQHADLPPWTVRYYVDENSLLRDELDE